MSSMKGKVVLITGASRGIGEATALHFASLGCRLSLMARNESDLHRVAGACRAQGAANDSVLVVAGDVTIEEDVANVVQKTVEHFGRIDILVNNAAVMHRGVTESASLENFDEAWKINLRGPLLMIQKVLPFLRQTKENAPYGVRVNTVNPGVIATAFGKHPSMSDEDHRKVLERLAGGAHAMGRVGQPEEVARCIAFLASDDASFVTGINMPIDGGMRLLCGMSCQNPWDEAQQSV